jgi:DNA-binding response OmpR family regulator
MNDPSTPTPNLEHVALPAEPVAHPPAAVISQSANPNPVTNQPVTTQSKSILIIEDERFISELYARALNKAGYSITTASDGAQALNVAVSGDFDLILLDIMLPTMNGVELLYEMKGPDVQTPVRSKVIITTNMDQKEETKAKVETMADGYLIKAEITPKELVTYVAQVLGDAPI